MHAEGKDDEAIASLRALADKTDRLGDEPEGIPAREQLADMLLKPSVRSRPWRNIRPT